MTRVAIVLHERLGTWAGQLRPRLQDRAVRWFETRSTKDLDEVLTGLASPVVLIDLARDPLEGLRDLDRAVTLAPGRGCWSSTPKPMKVSRCWPESSERPT